MPIVRTSRAAPRDPWAHSHLVQEQAIALGSSIEPSTAAAYRSALRSYLSFCQAHHLPIHPTPDTLSLYAVYMSHHIKPSSVDSYLSGISFSLESFFPDVRNARHHRLVTATV